MNEENVEIYSDTDWILRQITINEFQLSKLYSISSKERFISFFSLLAMFISFTTFIFFLLVAISPNGYLLVNQDVSQFSGIFCVFAGYILFISSRKYYEHKAILNQIQEYIFQQKNAIRDARDILYKVRSSQNAF